MLFTSWPFLLAFLPTTLFGAYLLRRYRGRFSLVAWLVAASVFFYAAWSPEHVPLLLGSVAFNFLVGRIVAERRSSGRPGAALLGLGVGANLCVLAAFKYASFLIENLSAITGATIRVPHIELPVGISFYTFTQIAFLVDVARGRAQEYGLGRYALFVTYFPHLVAGPVIHHGQVIPQFASARFCRWDPQDILTGCCLFTLGIGKKVLVADSLAPFADAVFDGAAQGINPTLWEAWGGLLAYSLQLYFDFSGYSDMALGLSRLLGVDLPANFNSPYRSASIIDFWRRWHMTLSQFLRDYVYFALGGNRLGPARRYVNLMVTMLLGGLWHGASWTFVVWGGYHGLLLLINHAFRTLRTTYAALAMPPALGVALTFCAVTVGWSFFRADSLPTALRILGGAFGTHGIALPQSLVELKGLLAFLAPGLTWTFGGMFSNGVVEDVKTWVMLTGAALVLALAAPNSLRISEYVDQIGRDSRIQTRRALWGSLVVAGLGVLFALSLAALRDHSPFIYYQF